jgi:hypothetical protein
MAPKWHMAGPVEKEGRSPSPGHTPRRGSSTPCCGLTPPPPHPTHTHPGVCNKGQLRAYQPQQQQLVGSTAGLQLLAGLNIGLTALAPRQSAVRSASDSPPF